MRLISRLFSAALLGLIVGAPPALGQTSRLTCQMQYPNDVYLGDEYCHRSSHAQSPTPPPPVPPNPFGNSETGSTGNPFQNGATNNAENPFRQAGTSISNNSAQQSPAVAWGTRMLTRAQCELAGGVADSAVSLPGDLDPVRTCREIPESPQAWSIRTAERERARAAYERAHANDPRCADSRGCTVSVK